MTYSIKVHVDFESDLKKLIRPIQDQLYKKLLKIVENPHIAKNRLHGDLSNCYKIKLVVHFFSFMRSLSGRIVYLIIKIKVIAFNI